MRLSAIKQVTERYLAHRTLCGLHRGLRLEESRFGGMRTTGPRARAWERP